MKFPLIVGRLFSKGFSNLASMALKASNKSSYVWIDLELTGLDVNKHTILEIACIITTPNLNRVHDGINLIIHHSDDVLESMNEWSLVNHAKSGLTQSCRESTLSLAEAEQQVVDYIQQHTDPEGRRYIAGNSVYMDKLFIGKHMPLVDKLLHYRIIDVSSLKTILKNWYPDEFAKMPDKNITHRALDDIRASIKELEYYRETFIKI